MSNTFVCPECSEVFKSEISWSLHYDRRHNIVKWFETFEKVLQSGSKHNIIPYNTYQNISKQISNIKKLPEFNIDKQIVKKNQNKQRIKKFKEDISK